MNNNLMLSKLIKILENMLEEYGDLPVGAVYDGYHIEYKNPETSEDDEIDEVFIFKYGQEPFQPFVCLFHS